MVVQVVICKCHPSKFRSGGTKIAGGEGQEYEMVVGGYEGGVAVGDDNGVTYMEVGEQRGQSGKHTFELQQNEAYGTCSS